jgi:hypothetical protein
MSEGMPHAPRRAQNERVEALPQFKQALLAVAFILQILGIASHTEKGKAAWFALMSAPGAERTNTVSNSAAAAPHAGTSRTEQGKAPAAQGITWNYPEKPVHYVPPRMKAAKKGK